MEKLQILNLKISIGNLFKARIGLCSSIYWILSKMSIVSTASSYSIYLESHFMFLLLDMKDSSPFTSSIKIRSCIRTIRTQWNSTSKPFLCYHRKKPVTHICIRKFKSQLTTRICFYCCFTQIVKNSLSSTDFIGTHRFRLSLLG